VTVVVNGVDREVPDGATVSELLTTLDLPPALRGVAVARNGDVVLRAQWGVTELVDGDRVEVLHAVQGG
jgi:sulfur carrier protein